MTQFILRQYAAATAALGPNRWWQRERAFVWVLLAGLLAVAVVDPALFDVIRGTLADAYLGVSVFVALTLASFYVLDQYFKADVVGALNRQNVWQVPCAAALGALPGCGGAIIVVTQFAHGQVSFGALVAVLIATMGDAAFLLLASEPKTAAAIFAIAGLAGVGCGYLVNRLHGWDFLKRKPSIHAGKNQELFELPSRWKRAFWLLLVPGAGIGVLRALNLESGTLAVIAESEFAIWVGFIGAFLCIGIWNSQPIDSWTTRFARTKDAASMRESAVAETAFVSVWVILAFLMYELLIYFTGLDLTGAFQSLGALTPLLAVSVGFIPGCGPQILMTTLYLNGVIPLSAQLANAISNDGDALFPAIALAPRAAIVATLYSALPALGLGYLAFGLNL
ncbi:MAG: putative manganese transporter [Pseudomonadota bacterium]